MAKTDHTIVSDLLTALGVPFTADYTKQRFDAMPFKTLFGVSKLLQEYGVHSAALAVGDKSELPHLAPPFIAQTRGGLVIVTRIGADGVKYLTQVWKRRCPPTSSVPPGPEQCCCPGSMTAQPNLTTGRTAAWSA